MLFGFEVLGSSIFLVIISFIIEGLFFGLVLAIALKFLKRDVELSRILKTAFAVKLVTGFLIPMIAVFVPFIGIFLSILSLAAEFMIIYKMLDLGFLNTVITLIISIVVSYITVLIIPLITSLIPL
jgi:hypothetical protein